MKTQETHKRQEASEEVPQKPKSSKLSASCKFLCCAIFIIGVFLNVLLTTILLFGVENYHKADPVQIYEVFQTPKYAQTNNLLDTTQYLVLYGDPQSGIINFIQHEANLRTIQGKPVVLREIQENIIHKHMKESRHFVQMYLGQVPRGHHSWFILLENSETPNLQIEALKKKYPKDSIVLVAHQKLNVQGFVNHKFPALKSKELKEFMQIDLNSDSNQVNQIMELATNKDAPAIFQAYKSFQQSKARALEEAQRLRQQLEEEDRLRLEEEARKAAEQQVEEEGKKSKKAKKSSKGKKGKVAEPQEAEQPQPVEQQQQAPKQKKSSKKGKQSEPQPQVVKEAKEQKPARESKKKGKKSGKKQPIKQKVEEQLQSTLEEELAVEANAQQATYDEPKVQLKIGKGKKNKNKPIQTQQEPTSQPLTQTAPVQQSSPVQQLNQQQHPVIQQVVEAVHEVKEEPQAKQIKNSKRKGKGKKGEEEREGNKGRKGGKKSKQQAKDEQTNEQPQSGNQQAAKNPSTQEPVIVESDSTQ